MIKEEEDWWSDDSPDDPGPSSSAPAPTAPLIVKQESLPSSSNDLRSSFLGMGFSPVDVDRVLEENGDADENLLLEALIEYSNATSKEHFNGGTTVEGDGPPIEFITDVKQELKEKYEPLNGDMDKKCRLAAMNFSEEEINLAVTRLGENAPLAELVDFIVTVQTTGYAGEMNSSNNVDREKQEEDTAYGTANKSLALLRMGFTENEVSTAIENFGPDVSISELADSIFANRFAFKAAKEEDFSGYNETAWQGSRDQYTEDCRNSNYFNPWISKASSSNGHSCGYEDLRAKKAKLNDSWTSKASSSMDHELLDDWDETKPPIWSDTPTKGRFVKEENPEPMASNITHKANGLLSKAPYFFYANVVEVSEQTWRRLSDYLYGAKPEFVNCQFFSAFVRKEGYLHNLPTEGRSHIFPKPPMTIEDALPHTKKWWPPWDTRKQLSCISTETAGAYQICERLGKSMAHSQGILTREEQVDILQQCKRYNLLWIGHYKMRPIEPDDVEKILGYPRQHTEIWQQTDRLEVLKNSLQTDTIGYHLSVLKKMYPNGLRVLSIFSGIGGAEIALHKLGIPLRCVVSVEASDVNREILKRWWVNTCQTGVLKQIVGIEKLNIKELMGYMDQFGGFDIIVCRNPGDPKLGLHGGCISSEMDLNLFFEFVRVYQRIKNAMQNMADAKPQL